MLPHGYEGRMHQHTTDYGQEVTRLEQLRA